MTIIAFAANTASTLSLSLESGFNTPQSQRGDADRPAYAVAVDADGKRWTVRRTVDAATGETVFAARRWKRADGERPGVDGVPSGWPTTRRWHV